MVLLEKPQTRAEQLTSIAESVRLDPITAEILMSRLSAINDEAAMTMRLVSGSPVANEAYDMNVGLMDANGDCFAIGMYITIHALALSHTVKDILAEYADDPGIHPGDVFMSNDPYVGACHQMDVAVVAPIFFGDTLVAWTGSTVHQIDLGGPVEGQVQFGAQSILARCGGMWSAAICVGRVCRISQGST